MVVLPAASSPTIRIRISFFPHSLSNILLSDIPILAAGDGTEGVVVVVEAAVAMVVLSFAADDYTRINK